MQVIRLYPKENGVIIEEKQGKDGTWWRLWDGLYGRPVATNYIKTDRGERVIYEHHGISRKQWEEL